MMNVSKRTLELISGVSVGIAVLAGSGAVVGVELNKIL